MLGAIGATAGVLNLLNLLPIPPLDGSVAFRVLTRVQRLVLGAGLMVFALGIGARWAVLAGAVITGFAIFTKPAREPDNEAFAWFAITAAVLAWLSTTHTL